MDVVDGRVEKLHNEPPLTAKSIRRGGVLEILLVGSAAALLEGDDLSILFSVSGPVPVVVHSVAAQLAHPCPNGGATRQRIRLTARNGARVLWDVQPLIIAGGADHSNEFTADIDAHSRMLVHDTFILGRTREAPSSVKLRAQMSACHASASVFEDGLDTSLPGTHGPAGLHGNRVLSNVVAVGWEPPLRAGSMQLASGGRVVRKLSVDASAATRDISDTVQAWWHDAIADEGSPGRPPTSHDG